MIIIGLGNPGEKFNNTPHNIGFAVIDKFAKENNFPDFKLQKKTESLVSAGIIGNKKVILAKPQTFMNESGKTAKKLLSQNKGQEVVVINDDVDLSQGQIKIVKNRGSAGHKGVESIIKAIGNENFIRLRLGVLPTDGKIEEAENFVLKKFNFPEETLNKATDAIKSILESGLEKTMNGYNK